MTAPPAPSHLDEVALAPALDLAAAAPRGRGRVEVVVRRPAQGERDVLDVGRLDTAEGLVGDDWVRRGSRHTDDGGPDPRMQLTLVNAAVALHVAGGDATHALGFGDQLHVALDLSVAHLPVGTRLAVGEAVVEVSDAPHRGCAKFRDRYGRDALRFVNTDEGMALRLRGVNVRVVDGGEIRPGDEIRVVG